MKEFLKSIGHFLNVQIEWIKSFLSEPNGKKGSNKRMLSTAVVITFINAYQKVSIANGKIEDIPIYWALLIAAIIGLNIADYLVKGYINKSVNKTENKID